MKIEFYENLIENYDSDDDRSDDHENEEFEDEDFDGYGPEYKQISQEDAKYLNEFKESMVKAGLSKRTIRNHMGNVEFFLYDYLLDYCEEPMQSGLWQVDSFLGEWFIRKAMWSSVNAIKENITSLKKFYKCMMENGNITKKQYQEFLGRIKENKDHWFNKMEDYDNHLDQEFDENWYMDWLL